MLLAQQLRARARRALPPLLRARAAPSAPETGAGLFSTSAALPKGARRAARERRLRRLEERVQTKLPAALQVRARCTRVCARTQKALRGRAERGTRSPGCGMSEGLVQPQEERRRHGQARRGRPLQKIGFAASDA